jgi:hypothetical protein
MIINNHKIFKIINFIVIIIQILITIVIAKIKMGTQKNKRKIVYLLD